MTDSQALPVYIVDDDDSVREALSYVLEGYDFQVQSFESGEDFLAQVDPKSPAALILDSRMPGMSGQQVHDRLNQQQACIEVIFLTSHGDLPMAVKAFRDGACDFCQKPVNASELVPSLKKALLRSALNCRKQRYQAAIDALTPREQQLFELVVSGLLNKQIADQLCISLRTVEVHRSKMMERLEVSSITELVKIAEALKA